GKLIWDVSLPELPGASEWNGMTYDPKSERLVLDRWAASAGVNELSVWNLKSETGGLLRPSSPSLTVWPRSGISARAFSASGDRHRRVARWPAARGSRDAAGIFAGWQADRSSQALGRAPGVGCPDGRAAHRTASPPAESLRVSLCGWAFVLWSEQPHHRHPSR